METKTVIVTGTGGNVGQGILRNIRAAYPNVRIVGTDIASFTAGNHLCDATYQVPYAFADNYIQTVKSIVEKEQADLVIPSTDYEIYYLSLHEPELCCAVAASEASLAKKYLDKYLTFLYHAEIDVPFAKSWLPSEFNGETDQIIVKPREGRGSRGIHINPENPKAFGDDYMVQQLHKGKEVTTAFYVRKDGSLHGLLTMERELANGATSKSKTVREYDDQLRGMIEKMIAHKGLAGSINLQSIVDDAGNIIPFEVNCRISGTNSIRHNLGFQDVKYTLQEYLFNQSPDPVKVIDGIAIRLLYDVVYPNATDENALTDNQQQHIVY